MILQGPCWSATGQVLAPHCQVLYVYELSLHIYPPHPQLPEHTVARSILQSPELTCVFLALIPIVII